MTPSTITGVSRSRYTNQNMTDEQELARFAELRDSHDPHDAEAAMRLAGQLVQRYEGLVGAVVRRWRNRMPSGLRMLDFEDLHAAGLRGLWEALLDYDPEQEKPFPPFATTRISWVISGEVKSADFLKDHARREVLRCWRAVSSLENRLGREASEQEAAEASGVSVGRYRQVLSWDNRSVTARLTEPVEKYLSGLSDTDGGDPLERLCAVEEALDELTPNKSEDVARAAAEIGAAVENIRGYFELEGVA